MRDFLQMYKYEVGLVTAASMTKLEGIYNEMIVYIYIYVI